MASDFGTESESSSQNSFRKWKWQWLLDQRKQFYDRVEQFMDELHDKFFTCTDVVREHQIVETAFAFLSQSVPNIDTTTPQEVGKRSVPHIEEFERLETAVRKLEQETEKLQEGSQKQKEDTDKQSELICSLEERLQTLVGDIDSKQDETRTLSEMDKSGGVFQRQSQDEIKSLSDAVSTIVERLDRLDETTDRIQGETIATAQSFTVSLGKLQEEFKENDDQRMKEMGTAIAKLKNQRKKDSKKLKKDRKSFAELKNSQKLALKACAQHLSGLSSSLKTARSTQVVSDGGNNQKSPSTACEQQLTFSDSPPEKTMQQKLALKACAQHLSGLSSSLKTARSTQVVSDSGSNQKSSSTACEQQLTFSDSPPVKIMQKPAACQGAAPVPVTATRPLSKAPRAATVLDRINCDDQICRVEVLSGGCILYANRRSNDFFGLSNNFLSLYNTKFIEKHTKQLQFGWTLFHGQCLQNNQNCWFWSPTFIVVKEPDVAWIHLDSKLLYLMHVTDSKISVQSEHNLDKTYSLVARGDAQTLAAVFGDPPIGVDLIDLKGQVKGTFYTYHKVTLLCDGGVGIIACCGDGYISGYDVKTQTQIFSYKGHSVSHVFGTGDGGVISSGDGLISRYDLKTSTKIFCHRLDQVPGPGAITYLPNSDTIIVFDAKTMSLCLLEGTSGSFIKQLLAIGHMVNCLSAQKDIVVADKKIIKLIY